MNKHFDRVYQLNWKALWISIHSSLSGAKKALRIPEHDWVSGPICTLSPAGAVKVFEFLNLETSGPNLLKWLSREIALAYIYLEALEEDGLLNSEEFGNGLALALWGIPEETAFKLKGNFYNIHVPAEFAEGPSQVPGRHFLNSTRKFIDAQQTAEGEDEEEALNSLHGLDAGTVAVIDIRETRTGFIQVVCEAANIPGLVFLLRLLGEEMARVFHPGTNLPAWERIASDQSRGCQPGPEKKDSGTSEENGKETAEGSGDKSLAYPWDIVLIDDPSFWDDETDVDKFLQMKRLDKYQYKQNYSPESVVFTIFKEGVELGRIILRAPFDEFCGAVFDYEPSETQDQNLLSDFESIQNELKKYLHHSDAGLFQAEDIEGKRENQKGSLPVQSKDGRKRGKPGRRHHPDDIWAYEQIHDVGIEPSVVYKRWIERDGVKARNLVEPERQFNRIKDLSWRN